MTPSFCGCIVPETNAGFYTDVSYEPEGLAQPIPRLARRPARRARRSLADGSSCTWNAPPLPRLRRLPRLARRPVRPTTSPAGTRQLVHVESTAIRALSSPPPSASGAPPGATYHVARWRGAARARGRHRHSQARPLPAAGAPPGANAASAAARPSDQRWWSPSARRNRPPRFAIPRACASGMRR